MSKIENKDLEIENKDLENKKRPTVVELGSGDLKKLNGGRSFQSFQPAATPTWLMGRCPPSTPDNFVVPVNTELSFFSVYTKK